MSERALVVANAEVAARILSHLEGTDCVAVADGRAAWQALQHDRFDRVFTMLMVPYVDGYELLCRIREQLEPQTWVAILSHKAEGLSRAPMRHRPDAWIPLGGALHERLFDG